MEVRVNKGLKHPIEIVFGDRSVCISLDEAEDYTLIGTQAEQKKFIGNAVDVNMSRVLCEALAKRLMDKAA